MTRIMKRVNLSKKLLIFIYKEVCYEKRFIKVPGTA